MKLCKSSSVNQDKLVCDADLKIPLSPTLSDLLSKTLLDLPRLQKTTEAKTLIHVTLEKVLKQVDDYLLQNTQLKD